MDQDGVMRRSEEEAVEVIKMGMSRAVVMDGGIGGQAPFFLPYGKG